MSFCCDLEEAWSDEENELLPPGYVNGMLVEYFNFCADPNKRTLVDCKKCKQVFVDVNPHEMKCVDDQKEEFQVILMVKFWWLDPDLTHLTCRVDSEHGELRGQLLELASNGDLKMRSKDGRLWTLRRGDYRSKSIEAPDMGERFFPQFTFGNIQGEATELLQRYDFLWSHEKMGTFVSWEQKIDAIFSENLELQNFPLDRQLCRVKLIAEKPIEEFQFVMMKKDYPSRFSRVCDTFDVDLEMQALCTAYVRYSDYEVPFKTQRSMVKLVFHLDRKGDYYFNNILMMVFLVNVMALCAFGVPLHDAGGRLGLVSSCFLAVLAYRYIINEILPKKAYLTAADKYITFACMFLIAICVQTVLFAWRFRSAREVVEAYDAMAGMTLGLGWVASNGYLWCLWKLSRRQDWSSVYQQNQEPYAPVEECTLCGHRWLSKQCLHAVDMQNCPECHEKTWVRQSYWTPKDLAPLVPPQALPDGPKIKMDLMAPG